LRAAAQRVVASAEPDDNFDGEYIEYLVQADVLDALRAALASRPAPAGLDRNAVLDEVMDLIDNIPLVGDERRYRSDLLNRLVSLRAATRPAEDSHE
jgi:hypothetical protein